MDFYRAREVAIHVAAYSICIGTSVYGGLKAPTISPGKLNSLEKIVEQPSSQVPVKIAKIGVGALVGFVASIVPVTLVMACLAENGYIGRRNEK